MNPESATGDSDASGPNPSEHMTHALSGFIAARVELASIEAKEAASFTGKKVAHGLITGYFSVLSLEPCAGRRYGNSGSPRGSMVAWQS